MEIEELVKLLVGIAAVGNAAAAIITAVRSRRRDRRDDDPSGDAPRLRQESPDDLGLGA
jgi:hypothetical protein